MLDLTIADVHFAVRSRLPVHHADPHGEYLGFLDGSGGSRDGLEVRVDLQAGPSPPLRGVPPLFQSGSTWSMYADGTFRYIRRRVPRFPDPLWCARVAPGFDEVTVWCGRDALEQRGIGRSLGNPVRYPLDQLLLMYRLSRHGGLLVHGAGADVGGTGLVFAGQSGAGKTTLSRLLQGCPGIRMLSDDRMVVRAMVDGLWAFGTPWPGEGRMAENARARLGAVLFLRHRDRHTLREMAASEALARLLPVCSVPWYDRTVLPDVLAFCETLLQTTPAYELGFRPDRGVADLVTELAAPRAGGPSP